MTIYYSASPRGFYDDAYFGPRMISVPDPQWIRPTKSIELLPGDSIEVDGEVITNTDEAPLTVPAVSDNAAVHPLIRMDNPACRIPADALPISSERHFELLDGQAAGQLIRENAEGHPILVDRPPPTPQELAESERAWRNRELANSDATVARHRDQRDLEAPSTLTDAEFDKLLSYRAKLRDWPEDAAFPATANRPSLIL
jgi:hypothetical protein